MTNAGESRRAGATVSGRGVLTAFRWSIVAASAVGIWALLLLHAGESPLPMPVLMAAVLAATAAAGGGGYALGVQREHRASEPKAVRFPATTLMLEAVAGVFVLVAVVTVTALTL